MFSHMEGTLVIAFILSLIVFVAAMAAEGRGEHLLRIMLGLNGKRDREQIFTTVEREANDLRLVSDMARLEEATTNTTEIEVKAGIDAEMRRGPDSAAA
jgi:hypothetical protein